MTVVTDARARPNTLYRHYVLERENGGATHRLACWLEASRGAKIGDSVSLEARPEEFWKVISCGRTTLEGRLLNQEWNVGGIQDGKPIKK